MCSELEMGGSDAVLQTLFYSSLLSSGEGSEISIRSVKDHFGYQSEIQSLETKTVADLDQLEEPRFLMNKQTDSNEDCVIIK